MGENDSENEELLRGRFAEGTDEGVERFTASVEFDRRLYRYDVRGSIAHAEMLAAAGVLTRAECRAIVDGLREIERDIEAGDFDWSTALEDVHMNIEARLTERIGDAGKRLHTGRSRNDQVATDLRLYLRDEIDAIVALLGEIMTRLVDLAERHAADPMPGFTHLQTAQPVTLGHHLLAWFEMAHRDRARFLDCRKRLNVSPLGAAALAGTTFPIDRAATAAALGFDGVAANSLDAVSDRDFAMEFCAAAALTAVHLSRWCEELVIWTSQQFAFIELPDAFCTGSSIMPQKKNPDVAELIRGKAGRATGNLVTLLMIMKAQPLAYNRDNQEDKEPLFDQIDTVKSCLEVFLSMLPGIVIFPENMARAATVGNQTATDLADYLVDKQIPFRDAYKIVGRIVAYTIWNNTHLHEISLKKLREFSAKIDKDVFESITLDGSISRRNHIGGTAPGQVKKAAKTVMRMLKERAL